MTHEELLASGWREVSLGETINRHDHWLEHNGDFHPVSGLATGSKLRIHGLYRRFPLTETTTPASPVEQQQQIKSHLERLTC